MLSNKIVMVCSNRTNILFYSLIIVRIDKLCFCARITTFYWIIIVDILKSVAALIFFQSKILISLYFSICV